MIKRFTLTANDTSLSTVRWCTKLSTGLWSLVLFLSLFMAGCKKDGFDGEITGLCPVVVSTDPMDKAVDVVLAKVISATFNTDMAPASINNSTFVIKQGSTVISGTLAPTADGAVFTFTPAQPLLPFTEYTGTITTGATDTLRTAMVDDYIWTFKTIPQLLVSATAGGTAGGGGEFAQSSVVTVTATPAAGFAFANWTDGVTVVSTSSSYQFTMDGNKALVANFIAVPVGSFAVNLSSNPAAGGTTTGAGPYSTGTAVTVTSTPNAGYTFTNWTENGTEVSTSPSYQFILTGNRTLVANFSIIPASQFAVILSSNPAAGGTTSGSGSFPAGSSRTVTATQNTGYTFTNWTENGTQVSTSATYVFPLNANKTLVANFTLNTYTLNVTAVNGTVTKNPNQPAYNHGTTVVLTATPNAGYTFTSWSGDATSSANPLTVTMNADKNITANFTLIPPVGPGIVDLGGAGDFSILTKSGISTTGITLVNGNIGVSPAAATSITGFGLIMDASGTFSRTPLVTGNIYASDYAAPTPSKMTTAVSDMETAYNTANGLVTPAPIVGTGSGNISGLTLPPGLYKWSTGVLLDPNTIVTLAGNANDTWVFQIAQDLTISNSARVNLIGGAQAKNIVWVVAGQATLGTNSNFSGNILSKTLISLNTGTVITGKLLAQTAVTLNASTVIQP